ncbi:MAG TPA: hypothetical protein VHV31_14110 [Nitrolancea sp.]|nr:hypothetical protein [Nitrolancea sp.]
MKRTSGGALGGTDHREAGRIMELVALLAWWLRSWQRPSGSASRWQQ